MEHTNKSIQILLYNLYQNFIRIIGFVVIRIYIYIYIQLQSSIAMSTALCNNYDIDTGDQSDMDA